MKRTTTLLLAALLLTACAETQPEAVAVRFDIGGVQSGTLTLRAYASDPTSRDDRDYALGWGGTSAEVTLAVANWYLFPTQAVEQAWGTFGLSFGSFREGFSGY